MNPVNPMTIEGRLLYRYPYSIQRLSEESGLSLDAVLTVIERTPPLGRAALPERWAASLGKVLRRGQARKPIVGAEYRQADARYQHRREVSAKTGYPPDSFVVVTLIDDGGVLRIAPRLLTGDWVLGADLKKHLNDRRSAIMHCLDLGLLERRRGAHGVASWRVTDEFLPAYNNYLALLERLKHEILTALKSRQLGQAELMIVLQRSPGDRRLVARAIKSLCDERRVKVHHRVNGGNRSIYCLYNARNKK